MFIRTQFDCETSPDSPSTWAVAGWSAVCKCSNSVQLYWTIILNINYIKNQWQRLRFMSMNRYCPTLTRVKLVHTWTQMLWRLHGDRLDTFFSCSATKSPLGVSAGQQEEWQTGQMTDRPDDRQAGRSHFNCTWGNIYGREMRPNLIKQKVAVSASSQIKPSNSRAACYVWLLKNNSSSH